MGVENKIGEDRGLGFEWLVADHLANRITRPSFLFQELNCFFKKLPVLFRTLCAPPNSRKPAIKALELSFELVRFFGIHVAKTIVRLEADVMILRVVRQNDLIGRKHCPEFGSWARNLGGFLKDWGDLHRVAGQLRPMIGVSEHAWNVAQDRLGKQVATAALALVFEKHCAGEVSSPGGYLRGMVEKAGAGELNLERSFYGRLSGQAA